MKQNIFLCGFMGCGKTTIGLELARIEGMKYVDLDEYIQTSANMSIPEIFEKFGEKHFRELETSAIKTLSEENTNTIISCGGGTMLNEINAENARKSGDVVFIDVPFILCYERIKGDTNRPLVMKNTPAQLQELYNSRYPLYEHNASVIVSVNSSDTPNDIANIILQAL